MTKMFIENTVKVVNKHNGREYDMFEQVVDLNFDGKMVHRYNIGINGYHDWYHVENIYSEDRFNANYERI